MELDPDLDAWEVVVVTGADFTTVHEQPAPEGSPDDLAITSSMAAPPTTATPPPEQTGETTPTTAPAAGPTTTTTEPAGYATGEPPPGVSCG